jgi:hypothetical protein
MGLKLNGTHQLEDNIHVDTIKKNIKYYNININIILYINIIIFKT